MNFGVSKDKWNTMVNALHILKAETTSISEKNPVALVFIELHFSKCIGQSVSLSQLVSPSLEIKNIATFEPRHGTFKALQVPVYVTGPAKTGHLGTKKLIIYSNFHDL